MRLRYLTGHIPVTKRLAGRKWADSYQATRFFLAWTRQNKGYPNFIHDLISKANLEQPACGVGMVAITGFRVQELWPNIKSGGKWCKVKFR